MAATTRGPPNNYQIAVVVAHSAVGHPESPDPLSGTHFQASYGGTYNLLALRHVSDHH